MLSLKWDICITTPSPKIQGSLWKSVFFKAVAPATSAVLQSVATQPRVYEQHRSDVMSLKKDIKFDGGEGDGVVSVGGGNWI